MSEFKENIRGIVIRNHLREDVILKLQSVVCPPSARIFSVTDLENNWLQTGQEYALSILFDEIFQLNPRGYHNKLSESGSEPVSVTFSTDDQAPVLAQSSFAILPLPSVVGYTDVTNFTFIKYYYGGQNSLAHQDLYIIALGQLISPNLIFRLISFFFFELH